MIELTRLGKRDSFHLNPDLIERIDGRIDTVIRLTNGIEYIVHERPSEIIDRIVEYRRRIAVSGPVVVSRPPPASADDDPGADDDTTHATVVELPANREAPR